MLLRLFARCWIGLGRIIDGENNIGGRFGGLAVWLGDMCREDLSFVFGVLRRDGLVSWEGVFVFFLVGCINQVPGRYLLLNLYKEKVDGWRAYGTMDGIHAWMVLICELGRACRGIF